MTELPRSGGDLGDIPMWRVYCERTLTLPLYVEAETRELAIEAAEELIDWLDADYQDDFFAMTATLPEGESYWSGGEDGDWITPSATGGSDG